MKILNVIRKIMGHGCAGCGRCSQTNIHIKWKDKKEEDD
jgi:hypothetical protein